MTYIIALTQLTSSRQSKLCSLIAREYSEKVLILSLDGYKTSPENPEYVNEDKLFSDLGELKAGFGIHRCKPAYHFGINQSGVFLEPKPIILLISAETHKLGSRISPLLDLEINLALSPPDSEKSSFFSVKRKSEMCFSSCIDNLLNTLKEALQPHEMHDDIQALARARL